MNFRAETTRQRCGGLALVTALVWLLSIVPAWRIWGDAGVLAATISSIVCLVPGCLVFWLAARPVPATMKAFVSLAGTLVRGGFAILGGAIMHWILELPASNYLVWLTLFYLVGLAVETVLLTRTGSKDSSGSLLTR